MELVSKKKNQQTKGMVVPALAKTEIKKLIKQEIKGVQEVKSFDTGIGSTFDNTGSITKLTTIPQGDTDTTRDGDHIKLTKCWCNLAVSVGDATNVVRVIVFRWNQDDSSVAPTVNDITQSVSAYSPIHRDNERAHKFDVIFDKFFSVSNVGPGCASVEWRKPLKSIIAFQATANTGTGHLYMYIISDSSAVPHPGVNLIWRTYYTDS